MSHKHFESPQPEDLGDPEEWLLRGLPHWLMDWMRRFTRLETEGLGHIPSTGPCLIVPNHSGALGWDVFVLQNEILKYAHRIPRTMSHAFWHQNRLFHYFASRLAFIPPDFKQALRVLRRNNLLIIFPEAEEGNFKPSSEMYHLQRFNPGFITLAGLSGAKIIPTCVIGAEETHINLGTMDWLEKSLGVKLPLPLNILPLPVQWKIIFLNPIELTKYDRHDLKNPAFLEEAARNVRHRLQRALDRELTRRGFFKPRG